MTSSPCPSWRLCGNSSFEWVQKSKFEAVYLQLSLSVVFQLRANPCFSSPGHKRRTENEAYASKHQGSPVVWLDGRFCESLNALKSTTIDFHVARSHAVVMYRWKMQSLQKLACSVMWGKSRSWACTTVIQSTTCPSSCGNKA